MQRDEILKTLARNHPRVLINESILDRVKQRIQNHEDVSRWYVLLLTEAEGLLDCLRIHRLESCTFP